MKKITYEIVEQARKTIEQNKECFVAQWILQNPDEKIEDYVLAYQDDWATDKHRIWLEKK